MIIGLNSSYGWGSRMPDLAELADAVAGLRDDRHRLAALSHRLGLSSGWLQVHGRDVDRVIDLGRLVYVQAKEGGIHFVLDDGSEVVGNTTYSIAGVLELLADYPNLVQVRDDTLVNLAHVRGIAPALTRKDGKLLVMRKGPDTLPLAERFEPTVQQYFGLPQLEHVLPWSDRYAALIAENIRDFEQDLHAMSADDLRREFHHRTTGAVNVRELMANVIWQYRCWLDLPEGNPHRRFPIGGNIRTFWYYLKPMLSRLGVLNPDPEYEIMLSVFNDCVGKRRLFRYHDFGFVDERRGWRQLGTSYPHIIMIAEKHGHYPLLQQLQAEFGFSIIALGGQPSLLTGEYFCAELAEVVDLDKTPLRFIAMVDYDPAGHIILDAFTGFMQHFGMRHHTCGRVVEPDRFAPEDLANAAYAVPMNTPGDRTKTRNWIRKFHGGIDGKPLGIECEALIFAGMVHPIVAQLFEEAKQPPGPGQLETGRNPLAAWGLPPTFSAELLESDPDGFWERWAENFAPPERTVV